MNIYFNANRSDDSRRSDLYKGSLFTYSASPSALKLSEFARELIEDAFAPLDPRTVQDSIPVEKCVEILAALKPKFIHHPYSKECVQGILRELGCDLEKTYFDVPRLRSAFPADYLTSGIAYAFHPHRDTWYSAPFCQVNWWLPVYDITPENCMAFHPQYWDRPVRNGSANYNYYEWNQESRKNAAKHIKTDTRVQPKAEESITLDPDVRLVCKVGDITLFSAAHLHSTVPNTSGMTRYSIDFRTVHIDDVWNRIGAPNLDSACTGTTMRGYLRGTDLSHVPDEAIALYDSLANAVAG